MGKMVMDRTGRAETPQLAAPRRQRSSRVVRGLWSVSIIGLGVLVLATLLGTPDRPNALLDLWLFHLVLGLACVLTALRPLLCRGNRLAWSVLCAGMSCWLLGDLYWSILVAPLGGAAPSPSISDGLYLNFYPCAAAAVLLLAARQVHLAHRALWFDGLVAGLGAAAAAALSFDSITSETGSGTAVLVNLAYPVADLILLGLTLAALAAQGWRLTAGWWYLSAGCLLLVVGDTNYLLQQAASTYRQGSPGDVAWAVAFSLLARAAWQPTSAVPSPAGARPALLVPTLVTAMSVGLLVAATSHPVPRLAVGLAAAALLVAAVRIGLAIHELRSLVESRRLSLTDELTGLGNRRLLQGRLSSLLQERRPGDVLAVLLLDLDRFKEVNDALGHHLGDELLRRIGPRVADALRHGDVLTRLGGDEFALLLGPGSDAEYAVAVAVRVRDALRAPFRLDDVELHLTVSVGVALCPDHALTANGLLQCADVAMYEAKNSQSGHAVYSGHQQYDRTRLETIAQLHAAVAARQIICHYQPQFDLATGEIVGAEALLRWEHPERGMLEPVAFLGLAGQVGLMTDLTRHVLAMAVADCQQWREAGVDLTVSVNLCGHSLNDKDLPLSVARLLRNHGLPAAALVLEVTEDVLVVEDTRARDVITQLQTLGVGLSIDDYGTGYSSLTQLRTLPVNELKLDRSYLAGLGSDHRDAAIVKSTVALAHALDLRVVAEGVETQDDWQELARLACDRAQGHVLSRPLPHPHLLRWLQERQRAQLTRLSR